MPSFVVQTEYAPAPTAAESPLITVPLKAYEGASCPGIVGIRPRRTMLRPKAVAVATTGALTITGAFVSEFQRDTGVICASTDATLPSTTKADRATTLFLNIIFQESFHKKQKLDVLT
jgi:hypothetical protein